uniref:Uncharacterized protein n=1 Tax=Rhizophora mucronata TaxID=61149 RepID=A0A2P2PGS4_RHIMU
MFSPLNSLLDCLFKLPQLASFLAPIKF